MRSLNRAGRHSRWLVVAAGVLLGAGGLAVVATAQTDQGSRAGPALLDAEVSKLAVVVMANQTPIAQADAQRVLPVLQKIQAQLGQRQPGERPDETAAEGLQAQLHAALPAHLSAAVDKVRLLTAPDLARPAAPRPEAGAADDNMEAPPPPDPGRGPRGGPGPGGAIGLRLLGPLVDFFKTTAAG